MSLTEKEIIYLTDIENFQYISVPFSAVQFISVDVKKINQFQYLSSSLPLGFHQNHDKGKLNKIVTQY